jgi:hypothetical protein
MLYIFLNGKDPEGPGSCINLVRLQTRLHQGPKIKQKLQYDPGNKQGEP